MKIRIFKIVAIRRVERSQNGTVPVTSHRRTFGGLKICIGVKNVPTFVRSLTPLQRFEARNCPLLPTHDSSIVSMIAKAKIKRVLTKKRCSHVLAFLRYKT